ncbi:MAG: ABC transporter ATP-binding protein/permease [Bacilli bacterium]|jgi:ATP-binding cassette subfamily B multidrug efflux pump|nr:ABC transporter ATP-binding protein/permease [Bacilli bacterium]
MANSGKLTRFSRADAFFPTMRRLVKYFRGRRILLCFVLVLVIWSSLSNILGTYFSKDVLNALQTDLANQASQEQEMADLTRIVIPIALIYLTGVLANVIYMQTMVRLTQRTIFQIRKELFEKMHRLPISYFDRHTHGEIMSYFTNDVDTIVVAMNDSFANIILSFSNIVGTIISMFLLCWQLSLIVMPLMIALFIFLVINTAKTRKYFVRQQEALASVNSKVEENLSGVKVEKAFNHEEASMADFLVSNEAWRLNSEKAFFHTQLTIPVNVSVAYLNFALSAVIGCLFLVDGTIAQIGNLSSFLVFVRQACQPFNFFAMHINNLLTCAAGAERIFRFLDEPDEPDNGTVTLIKNKETGYSQSFTSRYSWAIPQADGSVVTKPLVGRIEFKDVCFSYVPNKPILKHISFGVYPGKKVAFVGSTGAGKTTIISLLARFYPLDSGSITYDDIPIEQIKLESLRRALSMVTQDTHLFTGSIYDNIRYVRRHSTMDEVMMAAKDSHADSFIRRTPQGYDTMLYDDGANLSEGQRQLLGITRATLNQPPVMILDEATSNIDTRSEQLIQDGLARLMASKTVLVIAHRLSTIHDADEIIVLDHGTVIEKGTQDELLALKGAYYDLYTGKKELA